MQAMRRELGGLGMMLAALVWTAIPASRCPADQTVRFATYNIKELGLAKLSDPENGQVKAAAHIIQHMAPDILTINEIDYDSAGDATRLFQESFLEVPQSGPEHYGLPTTNPIVYPYVYFQPSNTGIPSGHDFSNDGQIGGPLGTEQYADDCYGFGTYPGQYGMAIFSKYPLDSDGARTFQTFLWKDMPGALRPPWPQNPEEDHWYQEAEWDDFRLSSKSHWDVPVDINGTTVHVLLSHPTPPVFDDPQALENQKRNYDEIRLFADYIVPGQGEYLYDDAGTQGGLGDGELFVFMGDQNAQPGSAGDSLPGAIEQILDSGQVNTSMTPVSGYGEDTGFGRVDYVLPAAELAILDSGVFYPFFWETRWGNEATTASDHKLVWVDVEVPEGPWIPGDFDEDRDVDASDYLLWEGGFGMTVGATRSDGDADEDGDVDAVDYLTWQAAFSSQAGGGVPEPSSVILMIAVGAGVVRRRKHPRSGRTGRHGQTARYGAGATP